MNPIFIGARELAALEALRQAAARAPVDVRAGQAAAQSVPISDDFCVSFSIETGHPGGTARHMRLSGARNRVPTPEDFWAIAEALGFVGELRDCEGFWREDHDRTTTINAVQLVAASGSDPSSC